MKMKYYVIKIPNYIGYKEALDIQLQLFDLVDTKEIDGALLILEHNPVLTMGIRTDQTNLLVSKSYLEDNGVELYTSDRGGDITFHGPGQIVAYPILRIKDFKLKLSEYMHHLEKTVIDTLQNYNIKSYTKKQFPGVWVNNSKICAIGVKAKRFITYHGLALNITTDKKYFDLINPCGIKEYPISSMEDFIDNPNIEEVKTNLIQSFNKVFNTTFQEITLDKLLQR